ncbi:hypothetical protein ACH5RR_007665 [Cinchona calisaya]|uniref:cysteine dioxygenase n=1 Tax=Cinchona calisaya TaxID=153742 RepID=A0ABD3A9V6_9GENT
MVNIVAQKLYETCMEVFVDGDHQTAANIPPPSDIERLKSILDSIKPEDLNLTPNMPIFMGSSNAQDDAPPITYIHLHECNKFSIGIFCLPQSAVIPLHNHPNMTVFSKVLFGSLRVKSYDWVDDGTSSVMNKDAEQITHMGQHGIRLAKVHVDSDFTTPCSTFVLYPAAGGNMHCFTALSPCAILDVLGPPYSESQGRNCTYFQDFPFDRFSDGGKELQPEEIEEDRKQYAWLQEREKPEDFIVVGALSYDPNITENS